MNVTPMHRAVQDHASRLAAGQACLDAALHIYLPLGFAVTCCCDPEHIAVGPKHAKDCDSPGKAPMHAWKALQTQLPIADELRRWWRDFPYGNVGVVLGQVSGIVRVDVDIAAPRGTGKSVTALALGIAFASGGVFRGERLPSTQVLLVDRDNPPVVVRKRLGWLGATAGHTLDVLTRDDAPPLKDKMARASFPVDKYAVVLIDSLGAATEGVSEKEGRQTQEFLATLKDLAHRGPAIVALDNTNKAATSYRGRGEKADAVDILYEARDITGWTPSTADAWWESLPEYGDHAWQQRATRCKGQKVLRIAFIPSKFRLGIEPEPFAIEIDTTTTPWPLGVIALFPTTWQGEKLLKRRQSGMLPSMSPLGLARGDLAWNSGSA